MLFRTLQHRLTLARGFLLVTAGALGVLLAAAPLAAQSTTYSFSAVSFGNVASVDAWGVALDKAGNLYATNTSANPFGSNAAAIYRLSPAGQVTKLVPGNFLSFSSPYGVTADPAGNVYLANTGQRNVLKISPGAFASPQAFFPPATIATIISAGFSPFLSGIASDASGNVYVTDRGNGRVAKITSTGAVSTFYPTGGGQSGGPFGIALDPAGNVYVSKLGTGVLKITPSGSSSAIFSTLSLVQLAVDRTGNLYGTPGGSTLTRAV